MEFFQANWENCLTVLVAITTTALFIIEVIKIYKRRVSFNFKIEITPLALGLTSTTGHYTYRISVTNKSRRDVKITPCQILLPNGEVWVCDYYSQTHDSTQAKPEPNLTNSAYLHIPPRQTIYFFFIEIPEEKNKITAYIYDDSGDQHRSNAPLPFYSCSNKPLN